MRNYLVLRRNYRICGENLEERKRVGSKEGMEKAPDLRNREQDRTRVDYNCGAIGNLKTSIGTQK